MCGTAAAASGVLTVMRTSSEPASASSLTWIAVSITCTVSVLVIDCTRTGASPPTVTNAGHFLGVACVHEAGEYFLAVFARTLNQLSCVTRSATIASPAPAAATDEARATTAAGALAAWQLRARPSPANLLWEPPPWPSPPAPTKAQPSVPSGAGIGVQPTLRWSPPACPAPMRRSSDATASEPAACPCATAPDAPFACCYYAALPLARSRSPSNAQATPTNRRHWYATWPSAITATITAATPHSHERLF
jgi:hypothetical protein